MPQQPPEVRKWHQQLERMRQSGNASELASAFGDPPHKQKHANMEIWHYPLGTANSLLYSIHVAVSPGQPLQVYMHTEPFTLAASVPIRPWWRFW